MPSNFSIVIPARYESTRLPGKPLIDLCGKPMIVRTFQQCAKVVSPGRIFVATDDERVQKICEQHDIQVLMTSNSCLTGTDRVAEAAEKIPGETVINVQGDEPVFNPVDLHALIEALDQYPGEIINGYCAISSEEQFRSPSTPKVVFGSDGQLMYMSRAAIPTDKKLGFTKAFRQVCAYAFPRAALKAFASVSKKTPLEEIEDIEILRFLELGLKVRMIPMSNQSVAVDHPADAEYVQKIIRERGL